MFSTKKTLIATAVATSLVALSACQQSGGEQNSASAEAQPAAAQQATVVSQSAASGEKIAGKWAANYREIIQQHGGKYLDREVMELILGDDVNSLRAKMDPRNPYSYEVDDAIDGGPHGNAQCRVPKAFVEVWDSAEKNMKADYVAKGFGTPISEAALKVWDINVDGDGNGFPILPDDKYVTVEKGGNIYVQFCGMCHGEFGEGAKGYLPLAVDEDLVTSDFRDPAPMKTIGNYWPYATTIFDYSKRAMPFWSPNSPAIGDAGYYGIAAYLIQANAIPIDDEGTELDDGDKATPQVVIAANKYMKNQGNFFCDHRPITHNKRCMKDCPDYLVGDGAGDIHHYRRARTLPDGTLQYNVNQRLHEDPPGVGHKGF